MTRREQILRGLIEMLATEGVGGATMAAISKKTGLAQGLLHYHFAHKQEMLAAALADLEARLIACIPKVSVIEACLDALFDAREQDREAIAAWLAIAAAAPYDVELREFYLASAVRLRDALANEAGCTLQEAGAALAVVEGAWRFEILAPHVATARATAQFWRRGRPDRGPGETVAFGSRTEHALRRLSPIAIPDSAWESLIEAYQSPGRHYHTLEHVLEVANHWKTVADGPGWNDPATTWLALLFHDAVMTIGSSDNEERSAALLLKHFPHATRAADLIRWTAGHAALTSASLDDDARCFLDCDMAILGASAEQFQKYEQGIAAEYAAVYRPDVYARGRRAFFDKVLDQPGIFLSEFWRYRLETAARLNLNRLDVIGRKRA